MADVHRRLAQNIRRIADDKNVALTHLADRAAVSRAQLFNVLAAAKSPTVSWLVKVADALEVDIEAFFAPLEEDGETAPVGRQGKPRRSRR